VGENAGGTWVAGALLPDVTDAQLARMFACALSGDWEDDELRHGRRRLVAALLVPVPGFPVAQPASVRLEGGLLVASAVPVRLLVDPAARAAAAAATELAAARRRRALADRIAASVGRGRAARAAALRGRVHPSDRGRGGY
jgi:hypothetical protein